METLSKSWSVYERKVCVSPQWELSRDQTAPRTYRMQRHNTTYTHMQRYVYTHKYTYIFIPVLFPALFLCEYLVGTHTWPVYFILLLLTSQSITRIFACFLQKLDFSTIHHYIYRYGLTTHAFFVNCFLIFPCTPVLKSFLINAIVRF